MQIPISKPYFGEAERRALLEPLDSGWVVQGPRVADFEAAFCRFTGARFAVATTSCTSALHLAMLLAGIGPGDEVIVPAFTWVATANAVEMTGARAVFADVELSTFNLSLEGLEKRLTPRSRAILPVSLFGLSADLTPLRNLCDRHGLKLIEDAACALGTRYQGHHAGTLADCGCFSFHPRKPITTGEGGMLITSDPDWSEQARCLRDHGASIDDRFRHLHGRPYGLPEFRKLGYNYRMTDLQGALGLAQLDRIEEILARRSRLAQRYRERLADRAWLTLPAEPADSSHAYQSFVVMFTPEPPSLASADRLNSARNALMDRLQAAGVATRPGTHAVHCLDYYRQRYDLEPRDFPNAYLAQQVSLALPLYPQLSEAEQDYVVDQLPCKL